MKNFICRYEDGEEKQIEALDEFDASCKAAQANPQGWGAFPFIISVWIDNVKYEVEPEIKINWRVNCVK